MSPTEQILLVSILFPREETLDADGIVAFGTADIEHRRVVCLSQGVQEWVEFRFVAAEEFGDRYV